MAAAVDMAILTACWQQAAWHQLALSMNASRQQLHPGNGISIGTSASTERNNWEMSRKREAHSERSDPFFWEEEQEEEEEDLAGKKRMRTYGWRKYGQRIVNSKKTNRISYDRAYYKCAYPGCSVKKTEEIRTNSTEAPYTTITGQHTHEVDPVVYGTPDPERTTYMNVKTEEWQWENYNPDLGVDADAPSEGSAIEEVTGLGGDAC